MLNITLRNPIVDTNIGGILKAPKKELLMQQKLLHMMYDHECKSSGVKNTRDLKSMLTTFDYISNAHGTFFIELDGMVVGMFMKFGNSIYNVVLRPKFRRKGILKHVFNKMLKGETLMLQVRNTNTDAMAAYEKLGFEVCDEWSNYYEMIRYGEVK